MKIHTSLIRKLRLQKLSRVSLFLLLLPLLFISIFLMTKNRIPHTSELSFSEASRASSIFGNVVPASCNSAPPVNHFAGDCPNPTVSVSGLPASIDIGTTKSDISWSSGNSTYCRASDGTGSTLIQSSGTIPARAYLTTTNFIFTCYNAVGISVSSGVQTLTINPKATVSFNEIPALVIPTPMGPTTLTTDMTYVPSDSGPTLSWSAPGATNCTASGNWSGAKSSSGSEYMGTYSGSANVLRSYTLSCTNGVTATAASVGVTFKGAYVAGSGCFVKGTKVLLGDNNLKNIEDVIFSDTLMTSGGSEELYRIYHIPYKGDLYAFNGSGNYFVTPTHPFMTTDGWKSFDPEGSKKESPGLVVSELTVGDKLVQRDGSTITLTSFDSKKFDTMVYNFGINGSHDFYADNFLVHNVNMGVLLQKASAMLNSKG